MMAVIKMKWQIAKLLQSSQLFKEAMREVEINEEVDFSDAVKRNPDIRSMQKVRVTGKGSIYPTERMMRFDLKIEGEMTLGCALTLDDVNYPFEARIDPVYTWNPDTYDEDSEDYLVKDTIELASAVWQEIFVQIPLRVVKDGAYEELEKLGVGFLTEENYEQEVENKIDPRLSVLKNLKFEE